MDRPPVIVLLGGFLGAGKTTLILSAARYLHTRGLKAAAILNDQGSELVDTRYVQARGIDSDQVTGGCFCCRFSELVEAAERLSDFEPAVIFAEAVGSCADISATALQPLKLHYSDRLRLAPYSVLVDPGRAHELTAPHADVDLSFLFRKQIEEADLICFTKSDLYTTFPEFASAPVRYLSPLTGEGVPAWLDEVLAGQIEAGGRILDVDYERYARAEASLAWFNCMARITLSPPLSPAQLIGPLLDNLDAALTRANLRIVHLKLMDTAATGYLKASLVSNGSEPGIEGQLDASPAVAHDLLINVRASGMPDPLQRVIERQLSLIPGTVEIGSIQCFSPAAPQPQWRYA